MSNRLAGKTAVITGGSSGIGLASVELFVEEGANVVIGDVQDDLGKAVEARYDGSVHFVHADVKVESDIENLVASAVARYGRLDVMFNNAGLPSEGIPILELDTEKYDAQMALLCRGVVLGHKYAGRQFVAQGGGGAIVTTASVAGLLGGWADVSYSAAKHAITGIIKVATAELGPLGIRSNAIYPGVTLTPGMAGMFVPPESLTPEFIELLGVRLGQEQPVSRAGLPVDMARAALFFASDESGWISGVALPVDGGSSAVYLGNFNSAGPEAAASYLSSSRT